MRRYNPSEIEPKWQQAWAADQRYKAPDSSDKPKYYVTGMFPYPSGAGMHTGHFFEHSIVDAVARFRRATGFNVMYPMGWDSFGLPAENYAIKTGKAPAVTTQENIASFKNQLTRVGASIDWSREINTTDPEYYKWTQWVFTQLYERGLAYQKESLQWWCPVDKTVLANEQVEAGKCWRCGTEVEKKSMKQWFFKITEYADALLEEIPALDWPDKIKTAQENWIGRSEGAEIEFPLAQSTPLPSSQPQAAARRSLDSGPAGVSAPNISSPRDEKYSGAAPHAVTRAGEAPTITVFTTRPDTIFGATFLVLAPEHPLARELATDEMRESVESYIAEAVKKSEIERQSEGKEKTGVWTGSYAINPATGDEVPIWIADYVLGGYGTGAIMAVPAHDERDYEFATKFKLPVKQVVAAHATGTGSHEAPREDIETLERPVVDAIITDGEGNYLLQIENEHHVHFVGGGIDDTDKSTEDALRREIIEEVGFTNIISIKQAAPYRAGTYLRETKNHNQKLWGSFFEVVVDSSVQVESEIDQGLHTIEWVKKDEVAARLNWEGHRTAWQAYLEGKTIDTDVREGLLVNSGVFDGMPTSEAREQIVAWLEQEGRGKSKVTYKMRDWLISRQRYWGAPIPIVHVKDHGPVAVPASQLPVLLPDIEDYAPKGDGKSALAAEEDWVHIWYNLTTGESVPFSAGQPEGDDWHEAHRETDTMDGYACSSWYLLRYTDPHNAEQAWAPEKADYWAPVDMYVGGDHAVAHLLYVRFWSHVFYDMKLVPTKEPVKKLVYHGLIQAEDGRKMSKSLGNVVDPLEVIDAGYGADALRTFELFLGPINENSNWSSRGIAGVYRFLNRVWTLTQEYQDYASSGDGARGSAQNVSSSDESILGADAPAGPESSDLRAAGGSNDGSGAKKLQSLTHATIKKVTDDIYRLSFNTAIAALMEYVNDLYKLKLDGFTPEWQASLEALIQLIQPFAPHMAAELWQQLGHDTQLDFVGWPVWDDSKIVTDSMTIVVQVNGKVRARVEVSPDESEDAIKQKALADANVQKHVSGEPKKVIYVKGRLISIAA